MDYLEYAYLQSGRFDAAKQVIDELATIDKAQPEILPSGFTFVATPARYAVERHRWAQAAALTLHPQSFPWDRYPFVPSITHFARALGSAHTGQVAAAQAEVEQLRALHERLVAAKIGYWADQVEILRLEAAAWSAHAAGDNGAAMTQMQSAVALEDSTEKSPVTPGAIVPAHELFADLLVELHQPKLALREYESSLIAAPNRFNALYGAAQAALLSGDAQKARSMYAKLVSVSPNADEHGAEIVKAKAYLKTASAP
jgi:tetratricopeptide (TPR) repeat protein